MLKEFLSIWTKSLWNPVSFSIPPSRNIVQKVTTLRCFSDVKYCDVTLQRISQTESTAGRSHKVGWFGLMGLDVCRQSEAVTVTQSSGTSLPSPRSARTHPIYTYQVFYGPLIFHATSPTHTRAHTHTEANQIKVDEKQQQRPSSSEINATTRVWSGILARQRTTEWAGATRHPKWAP